MTLGRDDLERQLELLALAIYDGKPNSMHNWAHDYIWLLKSHREAVPDEDAPEAPKEREK